MILFKFKDGSNPYIAVTQKEKDRMFKKYKNKLIKYNDNIYIVNNKEV